MKITLELETDEEKELAKRFLDNVDSPQVFTATEPRLAFRLLLALRQLSFRVNSEKRQQAKTKRDKP